MTKAEILEYLSIIEMKVQSILRDISNIRGHLENTNQQRPSEQRELNFFSALTADDYRADVPRSRYEQCPHN